MDSNQEKGTGLIATVRVWLKRAAFAAGFLLLGVLVVRAFDAWRSPPLELWHTQAPDELDAVGIDAADWAAWLAAETRVFDEARARVTDKLPDHARIPANRFFDQSPLHSFGFEINWNRTQVLLPDGPPRGAVVLLHGLTDSPYSMRHLAAHYRAHGFVAVTMRMPGHGTVPAGLTRVRWKDWLAAARLAMRHARALAGPATPLHLVGYSNGGALALKYSLDALGDASLPTPTRIVLISPMIGITSFARFAGVLGWPAVFPPFAKAAWLDIAPEFNPVKYNSFPVNAARQSSQLTRALREQIETLRDDGELERLAPVLTFQSAFDATVDVRALVTTLYAHLPSNGSELVLFDRNRRADASALVRPESDVTIEALLPPTPRKFGFTLVGAAAGPDGQVSAQLCAAGDTASLSHSLALAWPPEVYSLSHVALPFPVDDPLYGIKPSRNESYGVRLGTVAVRGERGVLIVSADTLMRMTSNPFFPYLLERIDLTP